MKTDWGDLILLICWSLIKSHDALITVDDNILYCSLVNDTLQWNDIQARSRSHVDKYRTPFRIWYNASKIGGGWKFSIRSGYVSVVVYCWQFIASSRSSTVLNKSCSKLMAFDELEGQLSESILPCIVLYRLWSWLTISSFLTLEQ